MKQQFFYILSKAMCKYQKTLIERLGLFALSLLLFACSYYYSLRVEPSDSQITVNGEPKTVAQRYQAESRELNITVQREGYEDYCGKTLLSSPFSTEEIVIKLKKKEYDISINLISGKANYLIDDKLSGTLPFRGRLEYGEHKLVIKNGEASQEIVLFVFKAHDFVFRFHKQNLSVMPLGIFSCGSQPKQINFSPDGRYFFITLLNGEGFEIFDLKELRMVATIKAGNWPNAKGFVEGLFIPEKHSYLVSQMSKNAVWEYEYQPEGSVLLKRQFKSYGVFPKVLAYHPSLNLLAVSNWLSNDVALIDYQDGSLKHRLSGLKTPRGVTFSRDGKYLFVASYDGGFVAKYSTDNWQQQAIYVRQPAAMRHLVLNKENSRIYVSDMLNAQVYELEAANLKLLNTFKVFSHPNTIDLTSDDRFLCVSCRGPNNPESYLLRSPQDGKVYIIDTLSHEVVDIIEGGNQPTALDISPDDSYLVFSNFLDANFEIYSLKGLYAQAR